MQPAGKSSFILDIDNQFEIWPCQKKNETVWGDIA